MKVVDMTEGIAGKHLWGVLLETNTYHTISYNPHEGQLVGFEPCTLFLTLQYQYNNNFKKHRTRIVGHIPSCLIDVDGSTLPAEIPFGSDRVCPFLNLHNGSSKTFWGMPCLLVFSSPSYILNLPPFGVSLREGTEGRHQMGVFCKTFKTFARVVARTMQSSLLFQQAHWYLSVHSVI